jgi:methylamine dehydrogenase heavy chain
MNPGKEHMSMSCSEKSALAAGVLSWMSLLPAGAQTTPPALPAETSDVATLTPAGPHRVFVMGPPTVGGANVIDADDSGLNVLGLVPVNLGFLLVNSDASEIYVAETYYSHGNRGTRDDLIAVYDGRTLNLTREIPLPGRLMVVPKAHVFELSADGRKAYVYDMVPSSRVHIVDLARGTVDKSVDLPGCALAIPYADHYFGTICGDGTVGAVNAEGVGESAVAYSKPFFDPNKDPLFESSLIDRASGSAWLLSFSGKIFPAKFGATVQVGKPWSINEAAGLPPAGLGVQELAWRPGGSALVMVLHAPTRRLYVLMHTGTFWTHKQSGTEVWVLDADRHTLLKRINLEEPARSISVSQDASPLLYASGADGDFAVIDANTGAPLRKRKLPSGLVSVAGQ